MTSHAYEDIEIRIFARREAGYPAEITLAGEQVFAGSLPGVIAQQVMEGSPGAEGRRLFEMLFADAALRRAWDEARGRSANRRVRLRLDTGAAELHVLPWELLCEGDVLLSANASTPFSRYLAVSEPWGGAIDACPLRVLAVIANPADLTDMYNLAQVDVDAERGILEAFAFSLSEDVLRLDFLEAPVTLSRIEEALQREYHVLHFVGHGAFNRRRGQAALYFQDEVGDTEIVRDEAFIAMLKRQSAPPRLVFLNACQSAARSESDALLGLGPQLVAAGVPAVVAMQDAVTIKTARKLALLFYRRLAEHGVVDCALNEARSVLVTEGHPDAAVPVLFMRLSSGQLWEPEARSGQPAPSPQGPPPPEPLSPPDVDHFVGREAELEYFGEKLAVEHLAVLSGMPGNGKTMLAAALAGRAMSGLCVEEKPAQGKPRNLLRRTFDKLRRPETPQAQEIAFVYRPEKVFWHTFYEGDGNNALIWKLAGFLYWNDQRDLWEMLQNAQRSGSELPPVPVLFDYIFKALCEGGYLLCFNDFHFVHDDPVLLQFFQRLRGALLESDVAVLIATLDLPPFVRPGEFQELGGLSLEDTLALFAHCGLAVSQQPEPEPVFVTTRSLASMEVTISPGFIANLHARTEGNLHFLLLAADALAHSAKPARLLLNLSMMDNIEQFLVQEIDGTLTQDERDVMCALAVLLGYPASRDAVEAALEYRNVRDAIRNLRHRHLLKVAQGEVGREYSLNAVVRHFYYDLLSKGQRRLMHQRAGIYYEVEEQDFIRAARHFSRIEKHDKAARLLTTDVWTLLNQGQAVILEHELTYFSEDQVEPAQWVRVNLALGEALNFLGNDAAAEQHFWQASTSLAVLPDFPEMQDLKAEIWFCWAELLRKQGRFDLALARLEDGDAALAGRETPMAAHMAITAASIHIQRGDYDLAGSCVQESLRLGRKLRQTQVLARAYTSQGWIEQKRGSLRAAIRQYDRALVLFEQAGDWMRIVANRGHVAAVCLDAGLWPEAEEHLVQAYRTAELLGSSYRRAWLDLVWFRLLLYQGRLEDALTGLLSCLVSLEQAGEWLELRHRFHAMLAEAYFQQGDLESAAMHVQEALGYFTRAHFQIELPALDALQAEILLASGAVSEAAGVAQRASDLARSLGMPGAIGRVLCVMGDVLAVQGEPDQALSCIAGGLAILRESGAQFVEAQGQLARARVCKALQRYGDAHQALEAAEAIFARLCATPYLTRVRALREEMER